MRCVYKTNDAPPACGPPSLPGGNVSVLMMTAKTVQSNNRQRGFTFVEVVAAVVLLGIMLSSVLVLMNRFVGSVIDMRLRQQAFELARSNMEQLLSQSRVRETVDYGDSETNPAITYQTTVEPF